MGYFLNFFGEGFRFWECYIPEKQFIEFNRLKKKHNREWGNLFFDLDFLAHFGYSHWSDLSERKEVRGFQIIEHNTIEIKLQNKIKLSTVNDFRRYNSETGIIKDPTTEYFPNLLTMLKHDAEIVKVNTV